MAEKSKAGKDNPQEGQPKQRVNIRMDKLKQHVIDIVTKKVNNADEKELRKIVAHLAVHAEVSQSLINLLVKKQIIDSKDLNLELAAHGIQILDTALKQDEEFRKEFEAKLDAEEKAEAAKKPAAESKEKK